MVDANFGRSHAARSTSRRTVHLAMQAGLGQGYPLTEAKCNAISLIALSKERPYLVLALNLI